MLEGNSSGISEAITAGFISLLHCYGLSLSTSMVTIDNLATFLHDDGSESADGNTALSIDSAVADQVRVILNDLASGSNSDAFLVGLQTSSDGLLSNVNKAEIVDDGLTNLSGRTGSLNTLSIMIASVTGVLLVVFVMFIAVRQRQRDNVIADKPTPVASSPCLLRPSRHELEDARTWGAAMMADDEIVSKLRRASRQSAIGFPIDEEELNEETRISILNPVRCVA